eukprot:186290-Rhodomonas_salina.4
MPDLQGIKKKISKGKTKQANKVAPDFTKTKVSPPLSLVWHEKKTGSLVTFDDSAKVGRKVEKANETNTSFKAKKLSLSRQSVAVDRAGKEVSRRGLTLWEIASQVNPLSAYPCAMRYPVPTQCLVLPASISRSRSPSAMPGADSGRAEFFSLHPTLIDANVGPVSAAPPCCLRACHAMCGADIADAASRSLKRSPT